MRKRIVTIRLSLFHAGRRVDTQNDRRRQGKGSYLYYTSYDRFFGSGRKSRQRWIQELTTGHSHDPFCRANEVGILAYSFPVVIVY